MPKIIALQAYSILDSRGYPTVQCALTIDMDGQSFTATASVPSGASTGTHEALELRDGGKAFHGKGVTKAIQNILDTIRPAINNHEFADAKELDLAILKLDPSENKNQLGANAILAVSMAAHRVFAQANGQELYQYLNQLYFNPTISPNFPRLMCNVVNGGAHADSGLSIQEFMLVPKGDNLEQDLQIAAEVYQDLKKLLKSLGEVTAVGDEGGFAPHLGSSEEVLDLLQQAIDQAGYSGRCELALDVAASEFYDAATGIYNYQGRQLTATQMVDEYFQLCTKYNIVSIEDGLAEDDIEGWKLLTEQLSETTQLVGDDLFVTNVKRLQTIGFDQNTANAILIKLNQIGSVSETADAINLAQKHNYNTIISHRSGETTDPFIADLAVASNSPFIKAGSMSRGERLVKYNRLLEILHS